MKGLKAVAKATQNIIQKDRSTWIPLYYNVSEDKVYMEPGDGRYLMTTLINTCTEKDVEESVHYFMNM